MSHLSSHIVRSTKQLTDSSSKRDFSQIFHSSGSFQPSCELENLNALPSISRAPSSIGSVSTKIIHGIISMRHSLIIVVKNDHL